MYVIDLNGEEYPAQITYTWEGELNGEQMVTAVVPPTKVNLPFLHDLTEMWTLVLDDVEYKINFLQKQGDGNSLRATIKGRPLFYNKFMSQRIHERVDRHMTADAFFNFVFHEPDELGNASGYNYILNGTFEAQQWEGLAEGDTRMEMFKNGLNRYKAEFRIVGNIVYIENMIGIDSQFRYEHRLNASNIVQEIDASEMYTYAKGYGDYGDGEGGEDWQNAKLIREYTSPLAQIPGIGLREAPPIKNGNITTRTTMDSQLRILVDESLKISVTANIHDLREQGYPIAQSNLGDRVFLIDRRIGFDEEIRVVSRMIKKTWEGKVIDASVTFGVPGLAKRHQANLRSATKSINDLLEGRLKLPFSVLDNAVANATRALHRMESQLSITDNGTLMAVDKSNPNNVVVFNAAGLGVSDDGGATFKNAITGLGINASVITAGTMLADRIAGGILSSLNGRTVFDLNNGLLTMQNTEFKLGGGANIEFTNPNNKLYYTRIDPESSVHRTAGIGVGLSINNRFPVIYMGATGTPKDGFGARDDNWFYGFIANTSGRYGVDGIGNSVIGLRFDVRNNAIEFNKGYTFNLEGSPSFAPINGHVTNHDLGTSGSMFNNLYIRQIFTVGAFDIRNNSVSDIGWRLSTIQESGRVSLRGLNMGAYNYDIGSSESHNAFYFGYISHLRPSPSDTGSGVGSSDRPYRWGHIQSLTSENIYADRVNGTVVGTSTKNAKIGIEDVDGKQAFDYFDIMNIKSFFYNDSDITNRFNRKVSPIIEQLDPVLENLYKATEEGLDINSNLFLLVQAFKYYVNITNERLEMLENGTVSA